MGTPFSGGSADIYKCFDQIVRPFVYKLLDLSGLPKPIIKAYKAFLENVSFYNAVTGGLGEPHSKRCSIPQGCPWSMTIVALIMRAWILQMRVLGALPRVLADDLTVKAYGDQHFALFKVAYNETIAHVTAMGGKAAPDKAWTFSSDEATRALLRAEEWESMGGAKVTCTVHGRDLGTHFNIA
jgi:hypothetical protein